MPSFVAYRCLAAMRLYFLVFILTLLRRSKMIPKGINGVNIKRGLGLLIFTLSLPGVRGPQVRIMPRKLERLCSLFFPKGKIGKGVKVTSSLLFPYGKSSDRHFPSGKKKEFFLIPALAGKYYPAPFLLKQESG